MYKDDIKFSKLKNEVFYRATLC